MKKFYLIISFISLIGCANAQFDRLWLLGYDSWAGLPWGGSDIVFSQNLLDTIVYHNRGMNFDWTNASICDSAGNLLFYTNGVYIANAQDDTMLNGSSINPSWYTDDWYDDGLRMPQADVIIPKPGNDSLYYLFHETMDFTNLGVFRPNYLYRSTINIKEDSGLGEVINKNEILVTDTLALCALTLCKHGNGRDWWLLVPEYGNNMGFYTILITPDTAQLISQQYFPIDGTQGGMACFSPDGQFYVLNNWFELDFFQFNRCTGSLTFIDDTVYADGRGWLGVSVSPNSQFCYVSHGDSILQFDLLSSDITTSVQVVATRDTFLGPLPTKFFIHQLAPDGKIYISTGNSTFYLHYIEQPDNAGTTCNVMQHIVQLPTVNLTIPNFPNYNLGPIIGSVCDSLGMGVNENATQSFGLRVNPNPCSNYFYLNYNIATNKNLLFVLYNSFGKEVLRRNLYGTTKYLLISTQGLSDGVYFGAVSSDTSQGYKRETVKVVVIKN